MLTSRALAHMVDAQDVNVTYGKSNVFLPALLVKLTVLPQRNGNFALGVMALPQKVDSLKNHAFSKVPQIPCFSFQDLEIQKKICIRARRRISRIPYFWGAEMRSAPLFLVRFCCFLGPCIFLKGMRLPCPISWDLQNSILMEIS